MVADVDGPCCYVIHGSAAARKGCNLDERSWSLGNDDDHPAAALLLSACQKANDDAASSVGSSAGSAESPAAFVERVNRELAERDREVGTTGFVYGTYINPDTEFLNAKANERYLEYFSAVLEQARTYENEQLKPNTARALQLLKLGVEAPAPRDPAHACRLREVRRSRQ